MLYKPLHPIAIPFLAILLAATGSCSRVSIAYNSADFLIERYARDYLGVEDPQIASWQPELEDALDRHRRDDLPYLARFFDSAHEDAVKGFDKQRVRCLFKQFEELYRRHMRLAVDLAAPLLADLTPDQIRTLKKTFRKERAEDEVDRDPESATRRKRKRAERYQESIAWWTGPLTERQNAIIREQTAAMPDTAVDWIAYRSARRETLIDLLVHNASEGKIHDFLNNWLVKHQGLPASLGKALKELEDGISELFIRLDKSLTAEQRAHFARRLAGLRSDFLSLQRHPHMAFVQCADAG